jgi:hypothetical protein
MTRPKGEPFEWKARPSSPIVARDNQASDVDTPKGNSGRAVADPQGPADSWLQSLATASAAAAH